jgi:hypothetical protein
VADDLRISDMVLKSALSRLDRIPIFDSQVGDPESQNKASEISALESFLSRGGRVQNFFSEGGLFTLSSSSSGILHTNFSSYGTVVFQLPTIAPGLAYGFYRYEDFSEATAIEVLPTSGISIGRGLAGKGIRLTSCGDTWVRAYQPPFGPMVWLLLGGSAWTEYLP